MTIAADLTIASDAAVGEIARLELAVHDVTTELHAAQDALGDAATDIADLRAYIVELEARIAELQSQLPPTWITFNGVHRRHDTGNVTGDGADAHLAAEEVVGKLLPFRSYTEFSHGTGGVKGTNRLSALLADPDRPAYIALQGGGSYLDVLNGKYDADIDFWHQFYGDKLGDRYVVWTPWHEPENDGMGQPEDHARALTYLVENLELRRFPNLRVCGAVLTDGGWQGAPIGTNTKRPDPRRWYAGLEGIIDLVGGDHYSRYPDSGNRVEPLSELAANGVQLAADLGLPYFVGEMGCHEGPAKAQWITDAYAYLDDVGAAGAMYSDVNAVSPISGRPLNYRVDSNPAVAAAWEAVKA